MDHIERRLRTRFGRLLRRWGELWSCPELAAEVSVEFSPRMTCSLGLAYPVRGLIRLNRDLLKSNGGPKTGTRGAGELLDKVLCHEAAHIAAFRIWGGKAPPHGPQWRELVAQAGYDPARTRAVETLDGGMKRRRPAIVYIHRCVECGAVRTARRVMRGWRCVHCVEAGLEGALRITSRPSGGKEASE